MTAAQDVVADPELLPTLLEDDGFVTMICGAGLRARIKVSDGVMQARIVGTGVRRTAGTPGRPTAVP